MAERFIKVLLIEDNPGDARLIEEMLATAKSARFHVESVSRLARGLERLGAGGIDVILSDLSLPDSQGLDTFRRVKARAPTVPIVILSSLDDEATALRAAQDGAQDYLTKNGLVSELLVRSLCYAIERKRVEDQLRKRELQLAEAEQVAHLGSYEWDIPRNEVIWSDEHYRILGFAPQQFRVTAEKFFAGVHPEDRSLVSRLLEQALTGQKPLECEYRIVRPDGEVRLVHGQGEIILDEERRPLRMIGTMQDVTEQRRLEGILRENEQREILEKYRALFEESKDALFFSTPEGKLVDVNAAAVDLFGFSSKEEMLSRSSMDLYWDPSERDALVRIGTQQGLVRDHPVELRRKDGKKLQVLVTAFVTRDENGKIGLVRGMLRDVTLQKQLEEQLLHAQKMEAIGRLAGGVAHDFNNLLTVIQTSTFFAKSSLAPDHPLQASLREIESAGKRAGDLTRQLLAFARRQVIAPRHVDLNELILDLEKMLRRLIGEDVELATVTAPDLGLVRVDPGQMEQVLVNLSVNARDAMPQGGKLIIETSRASLSAEEARRYSLPTFGDYALLTVRDNGCGMSAEVKARVFEPFFTTKELGKGTGLGLATCYGIVAQSGGQITAESEPGVGTTFRIYLPRFEGTAEVVPRANGDGVLPRGTETVLLVEDEAAVRNLVARVLRETGYTVLEAANGYEALRVAKSRSETPIRLVVSDVVMPEIGGMQAADLLRSVVPDVRVLFMSGYTDAAIVDYAKRNQGMAFLPKPFTPEILAHKVREVLDGGAHD